MPEMTSVYSAARLTPQAVSPEAGFSLSIQLYSGYEQIVDFRLPGVAVLGLDECPPAGHGWGPSPAHLLGAALGACLGGRLLAWLRARGTSVHDMRTVVTGVVAPDGAGRQSIARLVVRIIPVIPAEQPIAMPSPSELLDASVVARSIGSGIHVELSIAPETPSQHGSVLPRTITGPALGAV